MSNDRQKIGQANLSSQGEKRPGGAGASGKLRPSHFTALAWAVIVSASYGSAAAAPAYCDLVAAADYQGAAQLLEQHGCQVRKEIDVRSRLLTCPEESYVLLEQHQYGDGYDATASGGMIKDVDLAKFDQCGGQFQINNAKYDNPFVIENGTLKHDYLPFASLASLGLPPTNREYLLVCRGTYGCSSATRLIQARLASQFGSNRLSFGASEARVAGLDITSVKRPDLTQAIIDRGGKAGPSKPGPLINSDEFVGVGGVPGLDKVEIDYLFDRVLTVRYRIADIASYKAFADTLDGRYGNSSPHKGEAQCLSRLWVAGGVEIIGKYCSRKPEDSGVSFYNTGAMEVVSGFIDALKQTNSEGTSADHRPPAPKTDMY